jgi:7-keto-8-aminopelargonate synthetase-like enzyme
MAQHRHKYSGRSLLVVDAIYSADGTIANLPKARELCDEFNSLIVMDEAHSLGSLGATGHGIEEHFNMVGACDYICGVFSKTLSSYGGYVVSDNDYVDALTISPGVGFATGPHAFSAATVSKGLEIIERDNGKLRSHVDTLRSFYVSELKKNRCANIIHCGHNVFVSYPHLYAATTVAVEMRKRGYLISSFMFPSVPLDRSILRLTVTPLMTEKILSNFAKTLGEVQTFLSDRFGEHVMFGRHNKAYYDELHPAGDEAEE